MSLGMHALCRQSAPWAAPGGVHAYASLVHHPVAACVPPLHCASLQHILSWRPLRAAPLYRLRPLQSPRVLANQTKHVSRIDLGTCGHNTLPDPTTCTICAPPAACARRLRRRWSWRSSTSCTASSTRCWTCLVSQPPQQQSCGHHESGGKRRPALATCPLEGLLSSRAQERCPCQPVCHGAGT